MQRSTVPPELDDLIARLAKASWKDRDALREELLALVRAADAPDRIRTHLEEAKKGIPLEARWEIDEVLEATAPPPPPEPEVDEEPEPEKDPEQLSAGDLNLVYDDPRGLLLHKTKDGKRWFATQRDPRTGQPSTFELHAAEIEQLRTQLTGSPYWVLGSGEGHPK